MVKIISLAAFAKKRKGTVRLVLDLYSWIISPLESRESRDMIEFSAVNPSVMYCGMYCGM